MDVLQLSFLDEVRALCPAELPAAAFAALAAHGSEAKPKAARKPVKADSEASQIAIWEIYRGPGRPTDKPWGCPASIWGTIQKRRQRGKVDWDPSDVISLVERRASLPMGQGKRSRRQKDPAPRLVIEYSEITVYPSGTCSPMTARMVQEGRMPGLRWVPGVGAVRRIQVRKLL